MKFDIHFRQDVIDKIQEVVTGIKEYSDKNTVSDNEIEHMSHYLYSFNHCPRPDHPFLIGGADGSGDFPSVTYGDSFVYLVVALTRLYEATSSGRLKERDVRNGDIVDFLWLPEDQKEKDEKFKSFFEKLVGMPLIDFIERSDYIDLRNKFGRSKSSAGELVQNLIRPPAHDASNIRIQILSASEVCTLIRLLQSNYFSDWPHPVYLLADTTLTLPFVTEKSCLFFEVVKRYCCRTAREKGIAFFTISKSHNMPQMDKLDMMIKERVGDEHWYMRVPSEQTGEVKPKFIGARGIPPLGAVTYIFRMHKTTPAMRLDVDIEYWRKHIWNSDKEQMVRNERQIFRDLDFASHDQRSYGYPYPIKASHDFVSLTEAERQALKKQIIDAAERAGLNRRNFIDPSILTGHK